MSRETRFSAQDRAVLEVWLTDMGIPMATVVRRLLEAYDDRVQAPQLNVSDAATHRDIPAAHALVRRLCALQAHVSSEVFDYGHAADCFCGDEGYWPYDDPNDYRNDGKAIEFIESATLAAIKQHRSRAAHGQKEPK